MQPTVQRFLDPAAGTLHHDFGLPLSIRRRHLRHLVQEVVGQPRGELARFSLLAKPYPDHLERAQIRIDAIALADDYSRGAL
jgi:hypothetical protein